MTGCSRNDGEASAGVLVAACVALLSGFPAGAAAAEGLTIQGAGTRNPTLLYRGTPLLARGPISEDEFFEHKWGSAYFDHAAWLNWMKASGFAFARVYPAHAWNARAENDTAANRMYAWNVVGTAADGHPVVNLTQLNNDYWNNFARVLYECEQRGIVVCIQLYQGWYWGATGSPRLFFGSTYNANGVNETNKTVWPHMVDDYPNGTLWQIHKDFVNAVLQSVDGTYANAHGDGSRGNVVIDLMNEPSYSEHMSLEWIDRTLDIIQAWESAKSRDILVGIDLDHFLAKDTNTQIESILGHPRMELNIGEDHWIYETATQGNPRKNVVDMRKDYGKPLVWVNEKNVDYMDTRTMTDYPNRRRHYMWLSMMLKVQGAGMYEKGDATREGLLATPEAAELAGYNGGLTSFFNELRDYALLQVTNGKINSAPPASLPGSGETCPERICLSSSKEVAVYLHDHWGRTNSGGILQLQDLDAALNGDVEIKIVHPNDGTTATESGTVSGGSISISLPSYYENLAVLLRSAGVSDQPPVVAFTSPADGATVSGAAAVNAQAHDPDIGTADGDGIANVLFELLSGGTAVASRQENRSTYDWSLDTTQHANGSYILRATATSTAAAGGGSVSTEIGITVSNQLPPSDGDGDGLPDDWETQYGLDPTKPDTDGDGTPDPDEDADGDGRTNLEEYQSGTDPNASDASNGGGCLSAAPHAGGRGATGPAMGLLLAAICTLTFRAPRTDTRILRRTRAGRQIEGWSGRPE